MNARFTEPHRNLYEPIDDEINRIEMEYGIKPVEIFRSNLLMKVRDTEGWSGLKTFYVRIYKTGIIYHVLAVNYSLMTAALLFKAALDGNEEKILMEMLGDNKVGDFIVTSEEVSRKAVEFLSKNSC